MKHQKDIYEPPLWFNFLCDVFGDYVWVPLVIGGLSAAALLIWSFFRVFGVW